MLPTAFHFYFAESLPKRDEWHTRNGFCLTCNTRTLTLPTCPYGTQVSAVLQLSFCTLKTRTWPCMAAGNTMRQNRKDCGAECHSHTNPNFGAGKVCHGKALKMIQIASPPPSGATEQQPSLARGAGPCGGMTQSSGVGKKPTEQSTQHPIPPPHPPQKGTPPHIILIKHTTTVLR